MKYIMQISSTEYFRAVAIPGEKNDTHQNSLIYVQSIKRN